MANAMYNRGKKEILDGSIDLSSDTIRVMLVNNTYTYDADDNYESDLTGELSGTGYTAGGEALASKTITQNDTDDVAEFDAADVTWTGITAGTADAAIIYKDTGVTTTSTLIAYIDSGFPRNVNTGGDETIEWSADGIIRL